MQRETSERESAERERAESEAADSRSSTHVDTPWAPEGPERIYIVEINALQGRASGPPSPRDPALGPKDPTPGPRDPTPWPQGPRPRPQ